jgi:GMP reductase
MKFDFKNITLSPKKGIVDSRSECDTSLTIGGFKFRLPIVPANMESVVNAHICEILAKNGYFYIYHRFNTNDEKLSFVKDFKEKDLVTSISIGVNEDSYDLVLKLKDLKPDFITIDIAHGHSIKMEKMVKFVKHILPNTFLIGGNVSTRDGVIDLDKWGCDMIKCGIAGGTACTTDPMTGFGNRGWTASMIEDCYGYTDKPIIADGGIKRPSDVTKSLALGAQMVMVGSMLTGFKESPGNLVEIGDKIYKEYWGSASQFNSGKTNRIEGKKVLIDYKNKSILEELQFLEECLQSSISYAGGKDLLSLKEVKYEIFQ